MPLLLEQDFRYQGDDRWSWSIWLTGPEPELDGVEQVVYILHPTFPKPVQVVTDRATNFKLTASGWGTFTVHAKVLHRSGQETTLEHELELRYPDGEATTA
jgi:transcription initiation factor IIF auxiliary subunit